MEAQAIEMAWRYGVGIVDTCPSCDVTYATCQLKPSLQIMRLTLSCKSQSEIKKKNKNQYNKK